MADLIQFNFSKEAILKMACTPSLQDISGFFEFLRYQQYKKITQCASEEQRIEIQQSVKGLNHVEVILKQMNETKKFA